MPSWERDKDGEQKTPEQLFDEYYDKIYVYIVRRMNNRQDAEDLTSEVFFKAFAFPYDPQRARFSTYVYAIAANMLKKHYRSVAVRGITTDAEADETVRDDMDVPEEMIAREECASLKAALMKLPDNQYTVVYRRYFLDESFREIGAAMGISEHNARQIHFEVKKKLKKFLETPDEIASGVYTQTEGGDAHDR